ncbi:unnamed protein product [Danaus chrysippus]|uniref:(African queen) hypothetical protein n=1 Tax=Danaus chrysippus TaxID=151541 RepID=A0A8J2W0E6_9NEOP|nr:unnamed protein product [Danaus chrysippus]
MSTRSGRIRQSLIETSPPRTRKGVSPTRSPGRTRKSSPTARSAQKSPSRKSPSRKPTPKYPARKSPRAVKETKEEKVSPTKRPTIRQNAEVKLLNISSKLEVLKTTRTRRSEYISDDATSSVSSTEQVLLDKVNGLDNVSSLPDLYELRNRRVSEDSGRRRSSRFKDVLDNVAEIKRSLSKSHSKSMSKSVDNYSDEEIEEPIKEKSHSVTRKLSTPLPSSTTLAQINDKYDFMGLTGSTVLYIKSFNNQDNLNTYGNSGHFLYDFFMGRKIHDRFWKINIKLWLARTSNITALILTIIMFEHGFKIQGQISGLKWESLKEIADKVQLKPTVLVYAGMQMIYILYFIIKEKQVTTTFYWHSEGLGYLQTVSSTLYPFLFTTISKYIIDSEVSMPYYLLVTATIVYSLGFLLLLASNNIKYEFRENPLQPKVINLESMPTFHGKKLLTTHMWGRLRHPNYAGDILIHTALALPGVLSKQILACAPAIITILVLLHRSWRDHKRCRKRYGAAWHRYCMKVPSILIPKIF